MRISIFSCLLIHVCFLFLISCRVQTVVGQSWEYWYNKAHPTDPQPPEPDDDSLSAFGDCRLVSYARTASCVAAMYGWCNRDNPSSPSRLGAISQELGNKVIGVGCFQLFNQQPYTVTITDLQQKFHGGCKGDLQSKECAAASANYCRTKSPTASLGGLALASAGKSAVIGCVQFVAYENVHISKLTAEHNKCTHTDLTQTSDCLAAIHRYCIKRLNNNFMVLGMAQQLDRNRQIVGLGCWVADSYGDAKVF